MLRISTLRFSGKKGSVGGISQDDKAAIAGLQREHSIS
jgi:hypothetical protein